MEILLQLVLAATAVVHPVFPLQYGEASIESLKQSAAPSLAMSPQELYKLVPTASGIYFIGCPHCHGGAQESGVFDYTLDMGDSVKCRHCGLVFPNEKYPNNKELTITAPKTGITQVYRWHEDTEGHQYFFEAHAWWHRWRWTQDQAWLLANLYALTGDAAYGDRAAAIIGRYAQVYPDYPIRYDYPYRLKRFFPANQKFPYDDVETYRGAKFYWWAYGDIPDLLIRSYDLVAAGDAFERMKDLLGDGIRDRIETDLIRMAYEFTAANPDPYGNMSPGMYHDMIVAGRVIGEPAMVHEAVKRFRTLVGQEFFFDGWWHEGAPSYHSQTIGNLLRVAEVAKGYSDTTSHGGETFKNLDLEAEVSLLAKAMQVRADGVLPDGRMMPINDTWHFNHLKPLEASVSRLWPGLGHGILGAGEGDNQFQVHMNWSGAFGHSHADNGSIILWAHGKELLSDIGYTHTRYRNWTLNTASHNTVVVDERSQDSGSKTKPSTGNLLAFDDTDPHVRYMDLDATPSYPQCSVYRRRLVHVHAGDGQDYVVDVFDVAGGQTHDYFLHGSADEEGTLETSVPLDAPVQSLVPEWGGRGTYTSEQDLDVGGERFHAYDQLSNILSAAAQGPWSATWRYGEVGLRTHLFPQEGTRLYKVESPAIRGAGQDDSLLPRFLRHGILQRHAGGLSRFVAVHEPFRQQPWITEARLEGNRLEIARGGVTDVVELRDTGVNVTSSEGWTYASGEARTGTVLGLERGAEYILVADSAIPNTAFVRLDFTGGRKIVYRVKRAEGDRLVLEDDPGFTYDATTQKATFHSYPQEEFTGPLNWTLFAKN